MTDFIIISDNFGPPDPSYWVEKECKSTHPGAEVVQYRINTFNKHLPPEFDKDLAQLLLKYLAP